MVHMIWAINKYGQIMDHNVWAIEPLLDTTSTAVAKTLQSLKRGRAS